MYFVYKPLLYPFSPFGNRIAEIVKCSPTREKDRQLLERDEPGFDSHRMQQSIFGETYYGIFL